MEQGYEQRGYLKEDYRLFHLKGSMEERMDWHYHTFHKIILFLSGTASYGIEGRSYPLSAGDLVLVPQGCIHRPEVEPGKPYERVILYISPDFLRRSSMDGSTLEQCFSQAKEQFRFVVRPQRADRSLRTVLAGLEKELTQAGFGQQILANALLFQFLIGIARGMQQHALSYTDDAGRGIVAGLFAIKLVALIHQHGRKVLGGITGTGHGF
ncbi:MAG: AraC family ligand binding domain-containing protein, partial [Clostridia bacterium]|nr:AraC family ligand binding domain-containing protein [Clostridia bacterium]